MSQVNAMKALLACTVLAAGTTAAIAETSSIPTTYRVSGDVTVDLLGPVAGVDVFNGLNPGSESIRAKFGGGVLVQGSISGFSLTEGKVALQGALFVVTGEETDPIQIANPIVTIDGAGDGQILSSDLEQFTPYFDLPASLRTSVIDPAGQMQVVNGITISRELAELLGMPQAAGQLVGQITINMEDRDDLNRRVVEDFSSLDAADTNEVTGDVVRVCGPGSPFNPPTTGPDVIVGDINGITNYTPVGAVKAYSVGTTSCNIGTVNLQWIQNQNRHPVIPQDIYRFTPATLGANMDTKMRQLGQSFLKHGFFALSESLCCPGQCNGTDGTALGTGCSDPYTAARNGTQSNIGPSWEVNTSTGWYQYPWSAPAPAATIGRRLQVNTAELSSQPAGTIYFAECQYVSPDESGFGGLMNDNNNASHRRLTIGATTPWNAALASTTQRMRPAILAWQDNDNTVGVTNVDSVQSGAHDGRYIVAYDTTNMGGGVWRYEYNVYNLNGGRGVQSFSVPIPAGAVISNTGFWDVNAHSGDGVSDVTRSGTDWVIAVGSSDVTWSTDLCSTNANANALMWGTMFSFWFDANLPPQKLDGTLTHFRGNGPYLPQPGGSNCGTGTPGTSSASVNVPALDCNGNGVADSIDIATGTSQDTDMNGVPDECEMPPACPGDVDGDGFVGLSDIAGVITCWGQPAAGPCASADQDGDMQVGLSDIAVVSNNWAVTCP